MTLNIQHTGLKCKTHQIIIVLFWRFHYADWLH